MPLLQLHLTIENMCLYFIFVDLHLKRNAIWKVQNDGNYLSWFSTWSNVYICSRICYCLRFLPKTNNYPYDSGGGSSRPYSILPDIFLFMKLASFFLVAVAAGPHPQNIFPERSHQIYEGKRVTDFLKPWIEPYYECVNREYLQTGTMCGRSSNYKARTEADCLAGNLEGKSPFSKYTGKWWFSVINAFIIC